MEIAQLNIRGRMAYGIACLIAYINHHQIDMNLYIEDIDILAQFTSGNLADWDTKAKNYLYEKYSDEVLQGIPSILDNLYWIGAGELYGQPSDCKESDFLLNIIINILHDDNILIPDIMAYSSYVLSNPISTDDFFGTPFICNRF